MERKVEQSLGKSWYIKESEIWAEITTVNT